MQKGILTLILLVVIFGGALYIVRSNTTQTLEDNANTGISTNEGEAVVSDALMEDTQMTYPQDALVYEINDGKVTYTAQKRFFSKADEVVVGTSESVTGQGWISESENKIYVEATADISGLTTGSDMRDSDVQKMFEDKNVSLLLSMANDERVTLGQPFSFDVETLVTINGISKPVTYNVSGRLDENTFTAIGSAKVLMSDFGITPPSLISVYGVDDEIELAFDVSGTRVVVNTLNEEATDTVEKPDTTMEKTETSTN